MDPRLSTAILFLDSQNRLLLKERIGKHQGGKFGCPGGKTDFGETVQQAAERELFEETGIRAKCWPLGYTANCVYPNEENHFFCVWFVVHSPDDVVPSFVEIDAEGKPKAKPWRFYSRKELDGMPVMCSTKKAYDWYMDGNIGSFCVDEFKL